MSTTYTRVHPFPAYTGPQPVYRAHVSYAGGADCYVRRTDQGIWETAPLVDGFAGVAGAVFSSCPASNASVTRAGAVAAFGYYHDRRMAG